jgi:hypothetical protein
MVAIDDLPGLALRHSLICAVDVMSGDPTCVEVPSLIAIVTDVSAGVRP